MMMEFIINIIVLKLFNSRVNYSLYCSDALSNDVIDRILN